MSGVLSLFQTGKSIPLTVLSIYKKSWKKIYEENLELSVSIIQEKGIFCLYLMDRQGIEKLKIMFMRGVSILSLVEKEERGLIRSGVLLLPLMITTKEELNIASTMVGEEIVKQKTLINNTI